MEYRKLEQISELEESLALEIAIWGLDPRDAVPVNMLRAIIHGGGALHGAYDGDQLIGIALAFPASVGGRWILWSHMSGVRRDYQGQGIGFALKRCQREWALAQRYDEIRWTFDPLQRGNANFNLHILGAKDSIYHPNFYGVMKDEINRSDIPSDRLEAVWHLRAPHVQQRIESGVTDAPPPEPSYLLADESKPRLFPLDDSHSEVLAQIPRRLADLHDSALLLAWRLALREALTTAFRHGYTGIDFTGTNAYLLRRS